MADDWYLGIRQVPCTRGADYTDSRFRYCLQIGPKEQLQARGGPRIVFLEKTPWQIIGREKDLIAITQAAEKTGELDAEGLRKIILEVGEKESKK